MDSKPSIGVALSGGGIKGLAHLGLLAQLDELKLKPSKLAGTSMGSIIAALYASGLNAKQIEERICSHLFTKTESLKEIYQKRDKLLRWTKFFSLEKTKGGIIAVDGLFQYLFSELAELSFSDLEIPLSIVATDFHSGQEHVFEEGNVVEALKASIAVPGVFAPQRKRGAMLVDGGLVNNLPVNHIRECELRLASDVICLPKQRQKLKTSELLNGAVNIMIAQMSNNALRNHPCDIVYTPETADIGAFDIGKIELAIARGHEEATNHKLSLEKILSD